MFRSHGLPKRFPLLFTGAERRAGASQIETLLPRPLMAGIALAVVLLLAWSSTYSYLLFHTLVEMFAIGVAALIGVIAWYTYPFSRNHFLLFLGFAYPWIGSIDLAHTLTYKGLGIFPGEGANTPTQLWVAARAFEAVVLLVAPRYLLRPLQPLRAVLLFAAVAVALIGLVLVGYFPDAFIEGEGLTAFKINSEYAIIALLIGAWVHLHRRRGVLDPGIRRLIALSIAITIGGEIFFTSYADVYGVSNLAGHICKLASFWLIFLGLVHTNLREPFRLMSRDATTYDAIPDQIVVVDASGRVRQVNRVLREALGTGHALLGRHCHDLLHPRSIPRDSCPVCRCIERGRAEQNIELWDRESGKWMSISLAPVRAPGGLQGMVHVGRDISARKRAEMEVRRVNRALMTISASNHALVHAQDESRLLASICETITRRGGYPMAWVGYVEPDGEKRILPVASAGEEEGYFQEVRFSWDEGASGTGPVGRAVRSGQVSVSDNIAADPACLAWREQALRRGYASAIAFPLAAEGEPPFGVLVIYAAEVQAFTEAEIRLLEELAGDLAFGIRALRTRLAHEEGERKLQRVNRALYTITASNQTLVHAASESELLAAVARVMVEQGGYRCAWIGRREEGGASGLRQVALAGAQCGLEAGLFERIGREESGIAAAAFAARHEVVVNDIASDALSSGWARAAAGCGVAAAVALPLQAGAQAPFGVLVLLAAERYAFTEEEVTLLDQLAADLAYGIDALRTRRERDEAERESHDWLQRLSRSMAQTVEAIAATIEKRDPYTAGHQRRVAELAVAIARRMGLEANQVEGIRMGGVIHDIGKIAVPAEILNRPGPLSHAEYEIIKAHPQEGYEILQGVQFPWPLAAMVHQHHERLDGSGYPRGLKGSEIILEARILTVADVMEAMASHRPYRPGLGLEAALDELERHAGTLFDPAVVRACIGLFREEGYRLAGAALRSAGAP